MCYCLIWKCPCGGPLLPLAGYSPFVNNQDSQAQHMDHPLSFIRTLEILDSLLPERLRKPRVGIVCGSGLSGLVESFKDVVKVPYDKVPGFAKSTGIDSFSPHVLCH